MKPLALLSPLAMYSDFLMGLIALFFAYTLFQKRKSSPAQSHTFILSWSIAMLLLSIGVFTGGAVEGLKASYSKESLFSLKIVLAFFAGMASAVQVYGVLHIALKETFFRSLLLGVWGAITAMYVVLMFVFSTPGFKTSFIVFNTIATVLLFGKLFLQNSQRTSTSILLGASCQLIAILIFFGGWHLSSVVNSSVLFDLFLMAGLVFYYRGIMGGQLWSYQAYTPAIAA